MNKSLNLALRILGLLVAIAACAFAYLLKGKIDAGMSATSWTTTDPEIMANKEYDQRMKDIGNKVKALLEAKRTQISGLEGTVKDRDAEIADKKNKIEALNANVASLEGEKAELTRKRDELTTELSDANSKKESLTSELSSAKEELVKEKEKSASMFTKEQLDAEIQKTTKAEESRLSVTQKYAQLYNYAVNATGAKPPYPRDPLTDTAAESLQVEFAPETIKTRIVLVDTESGLVSFSVGDSNGIKNQALFKVLLNGKDIGKVRIESVQDTISTAQILVDSNLNEFTNGEVVTLEPVSGKLANN